MTICQQKKGAKGKIGEVLINAVCDAVVAVGKDSLGFKASEVGTHSNCSGAAMQMYLGECPMYTIMLIGRWSSNAFLRYKVQLGLELLFNSGSPPSPSLMRPTSNLRGVICAQKHAHKNTSFTIFSGEARIFSFL